MAVQVRGEGVVGTYKYLRHPLQFWASQPTHANFPHAHARALKELANGTQILIPPICNMSAISDIVCLLLNRTGGCKGAIKIMQAVCKTLPVHEAFRKAV